MSKKQVKTLLSKLQKELRTTEIDPEIRGKLRELDRNLEDLLDADSAATDSQPVLERAQELESRFATSHPVAERVLREIIDTLARMGV